MTHRYNTVQYRQGRYDLLRPERAQVQVIVRLRDDAPAEVRGESGIWDWLLDPDRDYCSHSERPYQAVCECEESVKRTITASDSKPRLGAVLEYLEACDTSDEIGRLTDERDRLTQRIEEIDRRLSELREQLDCSYCRCKRMAHEVLAALKGA